MRLRERDVVAEVRRLKLRELRDWVRAGWVLPVEVDAKPTFDETDIARIRLICDLRKELDIPNDAVPLVLSLLDQLHGLRRELLLLAQAIESQPEQTRRTVLAARTDLDGNAF